MALQLVNYFGGGGTPIGMFDVIDGYNLTTKGGEVATLTTVSRTGTDKAAHDAFTDGYILGNATPVRPVATIGLVFGSRPLFLTDDGTSGYGTLFGVVIGGTAGQYSYGFVNGVNGGTNLGPHTAYASGKMTLWGARGTYAITLDAVDTTASTGLVPTNTSVTTGSALYASNAGLLTPNSGIAFELIALGRFVEFEFYQGGSLVTTPLSLISAANSPSYALGAPQLQNFARAMVYFDPPT
jgi:hypothetical protein